MSAIVGVMHRARAAGVVLAAIPILTTLLVAPSAAKPPSPSDCVRPSSVSVCESDSNRVPAAIDGPNIGDAYPSDTHKKVHGSNRVGKRNTGGAAADSAHPLGFCPAPTDEPLST